MTTKLMLSLDETLIQQAKLYGEQHGKTVSQLVAEYFATLENIDAESETLPPLTASLKGLLKGSTVSQQDYREYLGDKYL